MRTIGLALLLISSATFGQNGGSGYSRYGIGDLRYFSGGRTTGMGGASIAVLSPNSIELLNPASWARISVTRFSVGTLYEGFSTSDAVASGYFSQLTFNGAEIAVPISTGSGVVASGGIMPYSRVNYNVITPITDPNYAFTTQYLGDGGISMGYLGSSVTVGDISLGAKFEYYFGTLNYTTRQLFSNSQYASAEVLRSSEIRGIGGSFGLIYSGLGKLINLPETNSLNLGLVFNTSSDANAT